MCLLDHYSKTGLNRIDIVFVRLRVRIQEALTLKFYVSLTTISIRKSNERIHFY
jgi:hypothetical protein